MAALQVSIKPAPFNDVANLNFGLGASLVVVHLVDPFALAPNQNIFIRNIVNGPFPDNFMVTFESVGIPNIFIGVVNGRLVSSRVSAEFNVVQVAPGLYTISFGGGADQLFWTFSPDDKAIKLSRESNHKWHFLLRDA